MCVECRCKDHGDLCLCLVLEHMWFLLSSTSHLFSLSLSHVHVSQRLNMAEQDEWTEAEVADLKEGLRKYGKAWGKIYREVGSGSARTATQCKQFFDNCSEDRLSELHQALAEHSSIKVGVAGLCEGMRVFGREGILTAVSRFVLVFPVYLLCSLLTCDHL